MLDYLNCSFELLGYDEVEEYAYDNEDIYGPDPDYDRVRKDLLDMKREYLEPFMIELEWFNKQLSFHEVDVRESTDWFGCISIALDVSDDLKYMRCSSGYCVDMQYARDLAKRRMDSYIVDGMSDDDMLECIDQEEMDIVKWLQNEPPKYGFTVEM